MNYYIIQKNNVLIYLVNLTEQVNQILTLRKISPFSFYLLATAFSVCVPVGLENKKKATAFHFWGKGAAEEIVIETDYSGKFRGTIKNLEIVTDFDNKKISDIPLVLGLGSEGFLTVSELSFTNKKFFSKIKLFKGDIVSDVSYFLLQSKQVKSAVISSVEFDLKNEKLSKCFGVVFSLLAQHEETDILWIENFTTKNKLKNFTSLTDYINKIEGKILAQKQIVYACSCTKLKMKQTLAAFSEEEILNMLKTEKKIEITCNFCGKKNNFLAKDLIDENQENK